MSSEGPTCIIESRQHTHPNIFNCITEDACGAAVVHVLVLVHWWRDISGAKRGASILAQQSLVHEPILTTAIPPERPITHILIRAQVSVVGKIISLTLIIIISII